MDHFADVHKFHRSDWPVIELFILAISWRLREICVIYNASKIEKFGRFAQFSVFSHFWATLNFYPDYKFLKWRLKLCLLIDSILINIFWASFGHRYSRNSKRRFGVFVISEIILQKMPNFECNFLKDQKRYLTFPVDFLKAQTMNFQPCCKHF